LTAVDFSPLINSFIGFIATTGILWFSAWLSIHMKNKQAALVVDNALKNGLGAMQQAVQSGLSIHPLQVQMPWISAAMGAGIQYVVNQVPAELLRLDMSKEQVAEKLDARLGVQNIATNVATAASPGPTPQPLSPIPNPSK
jgi:hypothetical protein